MKYICTCPIAKNACHVGDQGTGQQGYKMYMYMFCGKESLPHGRSGFNPQCSCFFVFLALVFYYFIFF